MRVIKAIQPPPNENPAVFLVQLEPQDFRHQQNILDFGLCQICRVTDINGAVVPNIFPRTDVREQIKVHTLQNGWFVDHFLRENQGLIDDQQRFIYFMDSFPDDPLQDDYFRTHYGVNLTWNRFNRHGFFQQVPQEEKEILFNRVVRTGEGHDFQKLPFIFDSTGDHPLRRLDFQVHLLYRTQHGNEEPKIHIGPGFTWFQDNLVGVGVPVRSFNAYQDRPSIPFINCLTRCVIWENSVKGNREQLIIDENVLFD